MPKKKGEKEKNYQDLLFIFYIYMNKSSKTYHWVQKTKQNKTQHGFHVK